MLLRLRFYIVTEVDHCMKLLAVPVYRDIRVCVRVCVCVAYACARAHALNYADCNDTVCVHYYKRSSISAYVHFELFHFFMLDLL